MIQHSAQAKLHFKGFQKTVEPLLRKIWQDTGIWSGPVKARMVRSWKKHGDHRQSVMHFNSRPLSERCHDGNEWRMSADGESIRISVNIGVVEYV